MSHFFSWIARTRYGPERLLQIAIIGRHGYFLATSESWSRIAFCASFSLRGEALPDQLIVTISEFFQNCDLRYSHSFPIQWLLGFGSSAQVSFHSFSTFRAVFSSIVHTNPFCSSGHFGLTSAHPAITNTGSSFQSVCKLPDVAVMKIS